MTDTETILLILTALIVLAGFRTATVTRRLAQVSEAQFKAVYRPKVRIEWCAKPHHLKPGKLVGIVREAKGEPVMLHKVEYMATHKGSSREYWREALPFEEYPMVGHGGVRLVEVGVVFPAELTFDITVDMSAEGIPHTRQTWRFYQHLSVETIGKVQITVEANDRLDEPKSNYQPAEALLKKWDQALERWKQEMRG